MTHDKTPRLDQIKRFLFVINPVAGGIDKEDFYSYIEENSAILKWEYKICNTTGERDAERIQGEIESFYPQAVIAVGGDGTVSLVAQILQGTDYILGIVPAGSGNGLSKDMGIPQHNLKLALDSLLHGEVVKIDTLNANKHFFLHLADVGFNAHIVKLYDNSESRGLRAYIRFVLQEFFTYQNHYYEVETDNGSYRGHAFMITVANSRQFGSSLTINPEGNWADGQFEVVIIKPFPKREALKLFWRLLSRKIRFSSNSIILKCSRAHISCKRRRTLQYDGEVAGKVKEVSFSIAHQNLHIIVP